MKKMVDLMWKDCSVKLESQGGDKCSLNFIGFSSRLKLRDVKETYQNLRRTLYSLQSYILERLFLSQIDDTLQKQRSID